MIYYFLLANVYALLFYSFYCIALKGYKNHSWSRFFLLASIGLSIVLPLLKFNLSLGASLHPLRAVQLQEVVVGTVQKPLLANVSVFTIWNSIYVFVVGFLLIQFVYRFITLQRFLSKQSFTNYDGIRLGINTGYGPASFGNVILFPENEVAPDILAHEKAHLSLLHHYDKMALQILRCTVFPIVAFHLIYRELMIVHEFEADELAASDKEAYSKSLLGEHFGHQQIPILQNFFHHPLKRRIMMLHKNKTSGKGRKALLLGFSAIALSTAIIFQSNTKAIAQQKNETSSEKVYETVDSIPEFPGGARALNEYLGQNMHYPDAARKKNITGRVVVGFVIDKNGNVKDVKIKKDIGGGCGEEAKRVVAAMPQWTPGRQNGEAVNVMYILPISFALKN